MTTAQKIESNRPILQSEYDAYCLCVEIKKTHGVQLGIVACDDNTYRVVSFDQMDRLCKESNA